jgi:hypothetical protein
VNVSKGTTGKISELLVSAHLLTIGWEVFQPVSFNCKCDLVINRPGSDLFYRIEVKTRAYLQRDKDGRITEPPVKSTYHILAVVVNRAVYYDPAPPWDDGLPLNVGLPQEPYYRYTRWKRFDPPEFDWADPGLPGKVVDLKVSGRMTIREIAKELGLPNQQKYLSRLSMVWRESADNLGIKRTNGRNSIPI